MAFELGAKKQELEERIATITRDFDANLHQVLAPVIQELEKTKAEIVRLFGAPAASSAPPVAVPVQHLHYQESALKAVRSVGTQTD